MLAFFHYKLSEINKMRKSPNFKKLLQVQAYKGAQWTVLICVNQIIAIYMYKLIIHYGTLSLSKQ